MNTLTIIKDHNTICEKAVQYNEFGKADTLDCRTQNITEDWLKELKEIATRHNIPITEENTLLNTIIPLEEKTYNKLHNQLMKIARGEVKK